MQKGTIRREVRSKSKGDVWVLRVYCVRALDNKKVERTEVIGPCSRFLTIEAARAEVDRKHLLQKYTEPGQYQGPLTFGTLATQWETQELDPELPNATRSPSTRRSLRMYLRLHIMPRWQNTAIEDMKPLPIQNWLRELQQKHSLANGTITRLRQIMSMAFQFARLYELIPETRDPLKGVKTSSLSDYEARIIQPSEAGAIFKELEQPVSTLTLLIASTGMRISEALGLKWSDVDKKEGVIRIRRSWTAARMGDTKTPASRAAVPCIPLLMGYLTEWRDKSRYNRQEDFIFASEVRKGKIPRTGGMISRDYLVPAAIRAKVIKEGESIGMHCLRHSLASFLVSAGVNPTTAQRMLLPFQRPHHPPALLPYRPRRGKPSPGHRDESDFPSGAGPMRNTGEKYGCELYLL